ncbi:MAG: redoxin domain-containing protein [Verrucomicrobiae bacterium]|nr:redoxin domain-containing protein [Verrucomicrobiae bacterium]
MKKKLPFLALAFGLTCGLGADIGDPAPQLQVAEWIKGGPINLADGKGKTVYVVEFWATWCPPCRTSIPHLTSLQKKFKDKGVVIIGISSEKVDVIKSFVEKMGDKMDYAVAADKDRKTTAAYMGAFGVKGIPHAFVVDTHGRIAWHGHPMAELEETIQAILDGKFDLEKAKKRTQAQQMLEKFYELAADDSKKDEVVRLGRQLEQLDREGDGIVPGEKFDAQKALNLVKLDKIMTEYRRAVFSGVKTEEANAILNRAKDIAPPDFDLEEFKNGVQLQYAFGRYMAEATGQAEDAKLSELAAQVNPAGCKQAVLLNELAWILLTDSRIKKRNLPLAMKLAKAAFDASEGKDPAILDTYARALADSGRIEEAIIHQRKAIELVSDQDYKTELEQTLQAYLKKAGK